MSDDEETVVRQRLHRLMAPPGDAVVHPSPSSVVRGPAASSGTIADDPPGPPAIPSVPPDADEPEPPPRRLPGPAAFDPGRRGVRA
ncbi:ComEA family DNA-binding protein, partial [Micromonospora sp. NPDC049799]